MTTPLTLLASQASFGAPLANFHERTTTTSSSSSSGSSSLPAGIGVIPTTAPEDDPYLCNESFGFANYKNTGNNGNSDNNNSNNNNYYRSALLVPRGQCSFERKALSAQRLGASAIIIYGTLSSRYSLNYTNTTANSNDAMTRTDYTFSNDVIWPTDKVDYDCNNGRAYIPSNELLNTNKYNFVKVPGGYDEQLNDEHFIGKSSNNVCVKYSSSSSSSENGNDDGNSNNSFLSKCESQRCLVTGKNITDKTTNNGSDNGSSVKYEACCAWDFAVWLYQDTSLSEEEMKEVTIPAVYITMQQATEFLDLMSGAAAAASNNNNNNNNGGGGEDPIVLSIYARDRPSVNSSAIIIWAVGVFVAWIASYLSAKDYRDYSKAVMMQRELVARAGGGGSGSGRMAPAGASAISAASANNNNEGGGRPPTSPERGGARSRSQSRERGGAAAVNTAISPSGSGEERTIYCGDESDSNTTAILANRNIRPQEEPESLELDATHALGFIVMASTSLLVLFFFKIYNVVKIMYAFGCSGAFAQVVLHPFFTRIFRKIQWKSALRPMTCFSEENATRAALNGGCKGNILMCLWSFFGPLSLLDVMTAVIAYGVGASWLYIAFTVPHPETVAIYWIIQDVFGACMCILFLETIKINAIRVAAILLTVAFFYDIFFVFITPLLTKHGESIMINVATSGGPPKADPAWCEKYPTSAECKGGDPLPMLFSIPRIGDYQGGSSMLGLGDIVLPGLLLSFASRFDEAKRLMGLVSGGAGRRGHATPDKSSWGLCGCCCGGGYFGPVVVAYAVGLGMANAAVYIMQYGQPALLYLVPCCLGTFCYMARKNGELNDIWDNPRVIRAADALIYGGRVETGSEDVLLDEDEDEGRAFSAMNEEAELT